MSASAGGAAREPEVEERGEEQEAEGLTFIDHLHELRRRLIVTVLSVAIGAGLTFGFAEEMVHILMQPVLDALPEGQKQLAFLSLLEKVFVYLRVSVYGGVFVMTPILLYQLWAFIAPGLYARERKVVAPFLFFGTLMFVGGGVFCYFLILPNAFAFLLDFGGAADWTMPVLTLKDQLSLVLMLELAFGVIFEIPVVIAFLALIGVVDAALLSSYRRHAVVVVTIAAAVITPTGDPFNLALMAVPMYVFYEVGIVLAWIIGRKRKEEEAEA